MLAMQREKKENVATIAEKRPAFFSPPDDTLNRRLFIHVSISMTELNMHL